MLVHAAGTAAALEKLVGWLHRGPPMARVDAVEVEVDRTGVAANGLKGFLER